MKKLITLSFLLAFFFQVKAQSPVKVGSNVGNVMLLNVDDRVYSFDDQKSAKGFILIFKTNSCDYCIMYKDRIIALDNKYKPLGFPVVAIAPYGDEPIKFPLDAMPEMKKWHKTNKIKFPYLSDNQFKYSNLFGIKQTPTAVILEKQKSGYQVKYIGRIDDNPNKQKDKYTRFVENEVNKLIKPVAKK